MTSKDVIHVLIFYYLVDQKPFILIQKILIDVLSVNFFILWVPLHAHKAKMIRFYSDSRCNFP
jgi:hypothetical protein